MEYGAGFEVDGERFTFLHPVDDYFVLEKSGRIMLYNITTCEISDIQHVKRLEEGFSLKQYHYQNENYD